jgi:hypothetical protein
VVIIKKAFLSQSFREIVLIGRLDRGNVMAKIAGFRVKNYSVIRDITLGTLWNTPTNPLTQITAVIGQNTVRKSTMFDAFCFVSDCYGGVE